MKRWISRILVSLLVLFILIVIVGAWLFHEAFGPKKRTVTINLDNGRTLLCDETYNADLDAVFYDVNFKLQDRRHRNISLGSASFSNENWYKRIQLYSIGQWYLLPVNAGSYSRLLFTNQRDRKNVDTTLSPLILSQDSLWKSANNDIPAWVYSGSSELDSIKQNKLFITFEYRFGLNDSFKVYTQTIQYEFDTLKGSLATKRIFEAREK